MGCVYRKLKTAAALKILQPKTVICRRRAGLRAYSPWNSRRHGRPKIPRMTATGAPCSRQQSKAEGAAGAIDGGTWSGAHPRAAAVLFDLDFAQVHEDVDEILPLQRLATPDGEAIGKLRAQRRGPLHRFANGHRARGLGEPSWNSETDPDRVTA